MSMLFLLFVIVTVHSQVMAETMSSSNFKIQSDSVNFGGARSSSASYKAEDTGGEIATGYSTSGNYKLHAGYQQLHSAYLSITPASDVALSPALGGVTGGTSNGDTSFSVTTDSPSGYFVTIVASNTPALISGSNSFADYVPGSADPDFTFVNSATASSFAFSPEGTDISQRFKDDGAVCNSGSGDAGSSCWDGLDTVGKTIVSRSSSNQPSGSATTIRFRAAVGSSRVQPNGTYTATTTITILPQ